MTRYLVQREIESVGIEQTIGIVSESDISVNTGEQAAVALALVREAYEDANMDPKSRDQHRIIELGSEATLDPWEKEQA